MSFCKFGIWFTCIPYGFARMLVIVEFDSVSLILFKLSCLISVYYRVCGFDKLMLFYYELPKLALAAPKLGMSLIMPWCELYELKH